MSDQPTDAFGNVNNNDVITGCVREVLHAIRSGLISDSQIRHYRNAQFIV